MAVEKVYIYSSDPIEAEAFQPASIRIIDDTSTKLIRVFEAGPIGPPGRDGEAGTGTVSEPFFTIIPSTVYGTSGSISFFGNISSSLLPYTSSLETSFDLGSLNAPWRSLYVSTGSIVFAAGGQSYVTLTGGRNKIIVGNSFVSTSSFGFDTIPILIRNSVSDAQINLTGSMDVLGDGSRTIGRFRSGSFDAITLGSDGVFKLGSFQYTPQAVAGGIIYSGSQLFVGV